MMTENIIDVSRAKELYAYSYPTYYYAMLELGYMSVKIGDAYDTLQRWKNPDSSGANEGEAKTSIAIWQDLENFKRDYDIRDALTYNFPPHPTLDGAGTEWHTFYPPQHLIKKFRRNRDFTPINSWIKRQIEEKVLLPLGETNDLISFRPRAHQARLADELLTAMKAKGTFEYKVMQDICPRGGKTTQNLHQFQMLNEEFNCQLMIVPMYVLGVMPSLKRDAAKFKQFNNMLVLDVNTDDNVEERAKDALSAGKQVVVGCSLHFSKDWYEKHKWINEYTQRSYVVVDEADFGAWTDKSLTAYTYLLANKEVCLNVTSGTNAKRMARILGVNIDLVQTVEYSELENSDDTTIVKRNFVKMTLPKALQQWIDEYDETVVPNWAKINGKPLQNSQFLTKFLRGLFNYEPEWGNSIEQVAGKFINVYRLKINATKHATEEYVTVANKACPEHLFVALNGDYTNNREAEAYAEQILREIELGFYPGKSKVVFVVQAMGSRSWSVGQVEVSLQCVDGGDLDMFKQEASRAITPLKEKENGWIIDCAFDPNRVSAVEAMIMSEAASLAQTHDMSIPDAVRYMYNNISFTNCDEFGFGLVPADELLANWEDDDKILEIADGATDVASIIADPKALEILMRCNTTPEKDKTTLQTLIKKSKTYGTKGDTFRTKQLDSDAAKFKKQVLGAIRSINSSSTTVYDFADGGDTMFDCLDKISANKTIDENFTLMYNISSDDVKYLMEQKHIPVALLDICVDNSKRA
jgi:hypothetical protein